MRRNIPPLNSIRAFEAAARYSSFTQAAEELNVTHAAVSRQVRELESWLGHSLFDRLGRGVSLTTIGIEYSRSLTKIFNSIHDATYDVAPSEHLRQFTVVVDIGLASRWLINRLNNFLLENPEIHINLLPVDRAIPEHLAPDNVCIMFDSKSPELIGSKPLCKVVTSPVCSTEYLQRSKLKGHDLVKECPLLHEDTRKWWRSWLEKAGLQNVNPKDGPMFYGHLALNAAEAGMGIALGDNLLAADAIASGELTRLSDVYIEFGHFYLIQPALLKRPDEINLFIQWLIKEIEPYCP